MTNMLPKAVAAAANAAPGQQQHRPSRMWWPTSALPNIIGLISDADVVLDGTDNFSQHYLRR